MDENREFAKSKITKSDIFTWYNQEITRYRDHEWQIAGFSTAITTAILLFGTGNNTQGIISWEILVLTLLLNISLTIFVEYHTHKNLIRYRTLRSKILESKIDITTFIKPYNFTGELNEQSFHDKVYYWSFLIIPTAYSITTIIAIINHLFDVFA